MSCCYSFERGPRKRGSFMKHTNGQHDCWRHVPETFRRSDSRVDGGWRCYDDTPLAALCSSPGFCQRCAASFTCSRPVCGNVGKQAPLLIMRRRIQ